MNTKTKQTTAADAPEAPRKDCTHNRMIETHDNPTWAWQCADCGYIYGKHGTPKPDFANQDKTAHTPGPWTLRSLYRDRMIVAFSVEAETRSPIAGITVTEQSQEDIANARLIATAPDLLEALKHALEQEEGLLTLDFEELGITEKQIKSNIQRYSAAIAKAEGNS